MTSTWITTLAAVAALSWTSFAAPPGGRELASNLWSLQPPRAWPVPAVKNAAWPTTDLDRFVLVRMEAKGLVPVGDADRRTLLRRAYFDLIGLPPKPEEVRAFVADQSLQAFAKVVDALLASPRFGERWGRYWLDVARYAESNGRDQNAAYPHAWRYRDYVIDAFNADLPFDRFITEQLAGDLLPFQNRQQRDRQIIATGFLAIGGKLLFERDRERFSLDLADEQIHATTTAFLGLSIACARCHNHKFDPVSMRDYYALAGIFRSTEPRLDLEMYFPNRPKSPGVTIGERSDALVKAHEDHLKVVFRAQNEVNTFRTQLRSLPSAERDSPRARELQAQMDEAQKKWDALRKQSPPKPDYAMAVVDRPEPVDCHVLLGGEVDSRGELAPRGFPAALPAGLPVPPKSSGRLELARWLTSPQNPLTARVMVNRVWLHLFGRGLVETVDNFGTTGSPPSHPELLDHLALRFQQNGWSVKKLIRELMLSRVYQLSSESHEGNQKVDADNIFLWRMSLRPLDAEALRDAILANSGRLEFARPEPSLYERSSQVNNGALFRPHRSVYLPVGRDSITTFQRTFDFADNSACTGQRNTTTVPSQSLFFLNSFFISQHSDFVARSLTTTASVDDAIRQAFEIILCRPPTDDELARTREFVASFDGGNPVNRGRRQQALPLVCHALYASADFRLLR